MKRIIIRLSIILMMSVNMQLSAQSLFYADTLNGCAPLTVHFTNVCSDTVNYNYSWCFDDGPCYNGVNAVHTFTNPGNYQIRLSEFNITGGFIRESSIEINVYGVSGIRSSEPDSACLDETVNLWADGQFTSLHWDLGDGTISDEKWVDHNYENTGSYTITLIVNSACGIDTLYKYMTITDNAVPVFSIYSNGNTVCPGDKIHFSNSYWMGESYLWDFGDGTTSVSSDDIIHTYADTGIYNVILKIKNICGNEGFDTVQVHVMTGNSDYANFWYNFDDGNCPGNPIHFNSSACQNNFWDFGDGTFSNDLEPSHIYGDTGTYTVKLIQTNGCGITDSAINKVEVGYSNINSPDIDFGFKNNDYNYYDEDTLTICPGEEVDFYNEHWNNYTIEYFWDFGDGSSYHGYETSHIFQNPGVYKIVLTGITNCGASDSAFHYVFADPSTKPETDPQALPHTICPGEYVYFFDNNTHEGNFANVYSIWFGDGDSLTDIDTIHPDVPVLAWHQYNAFGQYDYYFIVTNICGNSDTITGTINVTSNHSGDSLLYYVENSTTQNGSEVRPSCPGDKVMFYAVGGVSVVWHFTDGTTDTNAMTSHTYPVTGIYNEYVVITTGCGDVDTVYSTVTIDTTNIPDASFNSKMDGHCINSPVSFYLNNGGYDENYSFFWDFGDGTSSTEDEPVHQFGQPGNYTVTLTVTNGCGSSSESNYFYFTGPSISFSVTEATDCNTNDGAVTLNVTQGQSPYSYLWNNSITTQNLSNVMTGDYLLKITDNAGCIAETSVHVGYPIKYSEVTTSVCEGENVTIGSFVHNSTGTFIDTISSVNGCDSVVTLILTVYPKDSTTVTMVICQGDSVLIGSGYESLQGIYNSHFANIHGCDSTVVTYLYVFHPEIISVTVNASDCASDDGSIDVTVFNGVAPYNYSWSDGSHTEDIDHAVAGSYTVTVTDDLGCHAEEIINIGYDVAHLDTTITLCEGEEILIGTLAHNSTGIFHDTLITTSGCDSIVTLHLTVNPVDSVFSIIHICSGDSILVGGMYQYISGVYTDIYPNANGCDSSYITQLIVSEPFSAGNDASYLICTDTGTIDLMLMLGGNPDQGGVWTDDDNSAALLGSMFNAQLVSTGVYHFTYTVSDSVCGSVSSTMTLQVDICDGIAEVGYQAITIYPNPASDHIFIENVSDETQLVITDMSGRAVISMELNNPNNMIDLSWLRSGFYQLILNSGNNILVSEKLIIVK